MNNKKLLIWALLIALIWTTSTLTYADDENTTFTNTFRQRIELTDEQKAELQEIRELHEKLKNWETLTQEEQAQIDKFKANLVQKKTKKIWMMWWKWWLGMWFWDKLTDEEKTALESMTNEEKKEFFEEKRSEAESKREARETVIDKLLSWETLTSDEEVIKQEIIENRAEMKLKREEMEEIKTLMEKVKNGETLTDKEQAQLDDFKSNIPERKNRWWFIRNNK